MLSSIGRKLFGTFSREELKKFVLLAITFGLTIGVYWMLRPLKDGVFLITSGTSNQPVAKILSMIILFPLILVYSYLVDKVQRHKLFYILCSFYGISLILFGFIFSLPSIDLSNAANFVTTKLASGKTEMTHVTEFGRILGYAWYIFIESFGSLMVALFWTFASDTTTPESAKRGYPLIQMGAQTGGVVGPLAVWAFARRFGTVPFAIAGGLVVFSMAFMIRYFMAVVPKDQLSGYGHKDETQEQKKHEKKTGFLEGLKLLFSQPYLLGIFGVIFFFESMVTIFDFQYKVLVAQFAGSTSGVSETLGLYGVLTNLLSLLFIVFGINNLGRKLGLTAALLGTPIFIAICVVVLWGSITFSLPLQLQMYIAMGIMIVSKAINYALNQTSKEQLYIPTTKDSKYKSKAWIDGFGSRSSKASSSGVNLLYKVLTPNVFIGITSVLSLGLLGVWVWVALYLGKTHKKATEENKVVC